MTTCDHCGHDNGHHTTHTRAGRLCRRCHAHWLARGVLPQPPPPRRRGWPFDDDDPADHDTEHEQ